MVTLSHSDVVFWYQYTIFDNISTVGESSQKRKHEEKMEKLTAKLNVFGCRIVQFHAVNCKILQPNASISGNELLTNVGTTL